MLDDLRGGNRENIAGLDDRVELRTTSLDGDALAQVEDALAGADYLLHLAAAKGNDPDRGPNRSCAPTCWAPTSCLRRRLGPAFDA